MHEHLPPIDIAVSGSLLAFVKDMSVVAEKSRQFEVDLQQDALGDPGFHVANFRYRGESPHSELGAQLIVMEDHRGRVSVEVRAQEWSPDPPTYTVYCNAARALVGPLLSAYNRATGCRYRLRIPSLNALVPKLPPASQRNFDRFVKLANKSALHPLDWRRFYEFVWKSQARGLHPEDMTRLLVSNGFAQQYAADIADIYEHLVEFKGVR